MLQTQARVRHRPTCTGTANSISLKARDHTHATCEDRHGFSANQRLRSCLGTGVESPCFRGTHLCRQPPAEVSNVCTYCHLWSEAGCKGLLDLRQQLLALCALCSISSLPYCRAATGNRKLLSPNATIKTIFNDGWAPGCSWVADGAFNISIVPGTGAGQSRGLCTTFPGTGVSVALRNPQGLVRALANAFAQGVAFSGLMLCFSSTVLLDPSPVGQTIPTGQSPQQLHTKFCTATANPKQISHVSALKSALSDSLLLRAGLDVIQLL